jgi:hypothetical protein
MPGNCQYIPGVFSDHAWCSTQRNNWLQQMFCSNNWLSKQNRLEKTKCCGVSFKDLDIMSHYRSLQVDLAFGSIYIKPLARLKL